MIFSEIDMHSGYDHIQVRSSNSPKTIFRTQHGHFEFHVPYGVTNSPIVLIYYMNHVFQPYIDKFVVIFMENILIYSQTS